MPLIIHIGYHKTGSTAVQSWLSSHRETLEDIGILYPLGLSTWLGHPEVAWQCADNRYSWQDRYYSEFEIGEHYVPLLERSRDPACKVVLSSEEFCRLDFDVDGLIRLKNFLGDFEPIIVGYFRDPFDFLLSRYRHEVQHGAEVRPIRHFLSDVDNIMSAHFQSRTSNWRQVFDGRCVFRNYSDPTIGGAVEFSFGTLLGIDPDLLSRLLSQSI